MIEEIELFVKMQKKVGGGEGPVGDWGPVGGHSGCEGRIGVIVKIQKVGVGVQSEGGGVRFGGGESGLM